MIFHTSNTEFYNFELFKLEYYKRKEFKLQKKQSFTIFFVHNLIKLNENYFLNEFNFINQILLL